MVNDVISNLIAGAISWGVMYILGALWKQIINQKREKHHKIYSKKYLIKMFYWSTMTFPVFLVAGILMPVGTGNHPVMPYIKVLCFLFAFFSLTFSLGSFDAAISLYPSENSPTVPTEQSSDKDAKNRG